MLAVFGVGMIELLILGLCCLGPLLIGGITMAVFLMAGRNRERND